MCVYLCVTLDLHVHGWPVLQIAASSVCDFDEVCRTVRE